MNTVVVVEGGSVSGAVSVRGLAFEVMKPDLARHCDSVRLGTTAATQLTSYNLWSDQVFRNESQAVAQFFDTFELV